MRDAVEGDDVDMTPKDGVSGEEIDVSKTGEHRGAVKRTTAKGGSLVGVGRIADIVGVDKAERFWAEQEEADRFYFNMATRRYGQPRSRQARAGCSDDNDD